MLCCPRVRLVDHVVHCLLECLLWGSACLRKLFLVNHHNISYTVLGILLSVYLPTSLSCRLICCKFGIPAIVNNHCLIHYGGSPHLRNSYVREGLSQIESCASLNREWKWSIIYSYVRESAEIHIPRHLYFIGFSMTTRMCVLSHSNILPPPWCRCGFIPGRII
jgi:hypothetical protein